MYVCECLTCVCVHGLMFVMVLSLPLLVIGINSQYRTICHLVPTLYIVYILDFGALSSDSHIVFQGSVSLQCHCFSSVPMSQLPLFDSQSHCLSSIPMS